MNQTDALIVDATIKLGTWLTNKDRYGIECAKPDLDCQIIAHFLQTNSDCLIDTDFVVPSTTVDVEDVTVNLDCNITIVRDTPFVCQSLTINRIS
jgi:hypothetical protein